MTIASANISIRQGMASGADRRAEHKAGERGERALAELESQLEDLHMEGRKRIPATFQYPAGLPLGTRRRIHHGMSIAGAIKRILDELMEQPLPGWERRQVAVP